MKDYHRIILATITMAITLTVSACAHHPRHARVVFKPAPAQVVVVKTTAPRKRCLAHRPAWQC